MKKYIIIVALSFGCLWSCSREEIEDYQQSLIDWKNLKKEHGNSYKYTIGRSSWVGIGGITTIIVEEGIAISRSYEGYEINGATGSRTVTETYQETLQSLNSNTIGAPTLTIDQLYNSCLKNYLKVSKKQNMIYFETNDIGIITVCGFVPDHCADDCFNGFRIANFEWL